MSGSVLLVVFVVLVGLAFLAQRRAPSPRPALASESIPGVVPIEDAIDLHGFAPRDIPDVAESYLEAARAAGLREVRLIHGKGKGVQRGRIRALLAEHPHVAHYTDAPAHRGGWGAQIVTLEPLDSRPSGEGRPQT
ncbi:MAG: Smr/MutS family protein [Myxococcota bacterium]